MLIVSFYQVWSACSSRHDIQKYCFCTRFSEFQSTFSFVYFIIKCRNFSNFVVVGFFIRLVFSPAVSFPYTMLYKEVVSIMETAERLGMTNGEYAFITLDLNTDVFYKNGKWTGNEGWGSKFPNILNGIIDLSVYRPEISMEFKKKYRDMENKLEASIKAKLYNEVIYFLHLFSDRLTNC